MIAYQFSYPIRHNMITTLESIGNFLHIQKVNIERFIIVVWLFIHFSFFIYFSIFNVFLLSLAMSIIFYFLGGLHLFGDFSFIIHFQGEHFKTLEKATRVNTKFQWWFVTKKLLWLFLASPTQRDNHKNFLKFTSRDFFNECITNGFQNCFSFALIMDYW